jgi:hypothetical protein
LQRGLGFGLIAPKIGIAGFCFERYDLLAGLINVKENSERQRCAYSVRQNGAEDPQCGEP